GIPMSDLLHSNVSPLEDPHERVLDGFGFTNLRFNILWPGYRPVRFEARTVSADGGPLTRFDLAQQIILAYALFFRKVGEERLISSMAGYNIALFQGSKARADTPGIQFMQLYLVSLRLRKTSVGCWVADIEIV
ncbi:hypothetical protein L210DRAFT_844358, partial [Boletus edulis BED1]